MKTNTPNRMAALRTHEGAPAAHINAEAQLRRSVMASLLWEDSFYESGVEVGQRIRDLVHQVPMATAAGIAVEARNKMYLRHVPLLIVRELARHPQLKTSPRIVSDTLQQVIQRPDELAEFLAIYWAS